jgi:hypothetical protein
VRVARARRAVFVVVVVGSRVVGLSAWPRRVRVRL